jgi:cytochrome P450
MDQSADRLYTAAEMHELSKTREGRRLLTAYFTSARVAHAMQRIFEMLDVVPDAATQQRCCQYMYDAMLRVPIDDVLEWCQQVVVWKNEEYHEGNC